MLPKRKVALFSTSFLPYSQTFIFDEINAHSENYEITVFCKDRQNEDIFPFDNYHKPEGKIAEKIYQNIAYWPKFDEIFQEEKFDLIHAHFGTGAVYALPYVKKYRIPFVVTFHGNDVAALVGTQRFLPKRWRYAAKSKQIFKLLDLGLAVSPELINMLTELGCDEQKLKLFRLGISLDKFNPAPKPPPDPLKFLLIGRFTEKKGHIYALKAFHSLIQKGHSAQLSFIGDGELMDECISYAKNNDLEDSILFLGVKQPQEVQDHINSSHVLLVPSVIAKDGDREGLPTVIKEANACGVPAIGTYHAGIPELIRDEHSGFLVEERSVEQLSDKMVYFLENPEKIAEYGSNARAIIEEKYNIIKEVARLENYYESILSNNE